MDAPSILTPAGGALSPADRRRKRRASPGHATQASATGWPAPVRRWAWLEKQRTAGGSFSEGAASNTAIT